MALASRHVEWSVWHLSPSLLSASSKKGSSTPYSPLEFAPATILQVAGEKRQVT